MHPSLTEIDEGGKEEERIISELREVKILIRSKPAGEKRTHAARFNWVQAEELHCRILIAKKTSHEEEGCVCVCVCEKGGAYCH